jgi:hypothetical protein
MNINWKKTLVAASLVGLTAVPFIVYADGFSFNVKVGDDNEKHYRFRDRTVKHDPEMLRAAQSLAEAKNHLWYAKGDRGRRSSAIQHINMALDEISAAENSRWNNRRNHGR